MTRPPKLSKAGTWRISREAKFHMAMKWKRFLVDNSQTVRFGIDPVFSEYDEVSIDLVLTDDFQPWGRIPDALAPYPRTDTISADEIVVPSGTYAEGFSHVKRRHGENIEKLHPGLSLEEYLKDVFRHFQRAYLQTDGSIWLFRRNGVTKCAVVAPVMLGDILHYKLITAYPIRREPTPGRFVKRGAVRLGYS